MEKPVVLVGQQNNGTVLPTGNFSKKEEEEEEEEVLLRTMLLGEIRGLFPKIASRKNRSI